MNAQLLERDLSITSRVDPPSERFDRIDHLRALAALMVMFWHTTGKWHAPFSGAFVPFAIFNEGHTGVSIFCVLSGFILTTIYAERTVAIRTFYQRRMLRILPLLILVMFLAFYQTPTWSPLEFLVSFLGLARHGFPSFAGPGWTAIIELQFYAIFPVLLIFAAKYGTRYLVALIGAFVALRFMVWLAAANQSVLQLSYYSIFGRMDQFLAGMVTACFVKSYKEKLKETKNSVAVLSFGVGAVILFFHWFDMSGGFMGFGGEPFPSKSWFWVFMPTIEAILYSTILAGYLFLPSSGVINPLSKGASYLGRISYSIYLTHLLVIMAVFSSAKKLEIYPTTWSGSVIFLALVIFPATIVLSTATYWLIERPFMELRNQRHTN
jgi:peptidoglycan/LPS O-acetylase OafA/YrhL